MAGFKNYAKSFLRRISARKSKPVFQEPLKCYFLDGTVNIHDSEDYRNPEYANRFSPTFDEFKSFLRKEVQACKGSSYFKYGDGDYYFLKGEENGSAKPGRRALSKPYSEIDLPRFQQGSKKATHYLCEIPDADRNRFQKTFPGKDVDFPAEYVYAGVASRWFFREFDGEIGLIGAGQKIDLIEELLKFDSYKDYLGIREKIELIRVPQKFACDDLDGTISSLKTQLSNCKSKIFLFGVGHVKSGIVEVLPQIHQATYVDVGSGIDALAGVIDVRRPYFGGWVNFELPDAHKYSEIDWLQVQNRGKRYFLSNHETNS
jgi:hypothetical protein